MDKKSYDYLYKLLLIGDSGVGKTSLMLSYVDGTFSHTYISTIGIDFKVKTLDIDGKKVKIQIWDTAGQERFHTITTSYYRSAMGILLVYDVCERRTFENVTRWIDNITRFATESQDIVLVANKIDMDDKRIVSTNDGFQMAQKFKVRYAETSAKYRDSVEKVFHDMVQRIYDNCGSNSESQDIISDLGSTSEGTKGGCCTSS